MAYPVRSYSYGPDSSNMTDMSVKKRKRGNEGEDSLSTHLTSLSSSQLFSPYPTTHTPALSDCSSHGSGSPRTAEEPFIFSSPIPTFNSPRKIANPHKRTHFSRPSLINLASSPIIPPTPALTFASDNLSQLSQMSASTQTCHVCGNRPHTVRELSSYTDCEHCQKRTCFVCARVCEGPKCRSFISARHTLFSGATPHTAPDEAPRGKIICRSETCCVEVGADGHIWCTTCYADDTELENASLGKDKKSLEQESLGRIASWLQDCGPDMMVTEDVDAGMTDMNDSWAS